MDDCKLRLNDLVKSRFIEMFETRDCLSRKLSDVADVTGGLTKNSRRESLPLKLPYLRVANVSFNSIDTTEMMAIGLTESEKEKTLLKRGDLLFVEGNGSKEQIGRVAVWDGRIQPCVHQNHLIKARFDSTVLPAFALHYYMSMKGREQIVKAAVSTSGLYTLSTKKVASLMLPVPDLESQREFADFVAQVDKLKAQTQQSIDKLQLLYDSLAQEYFGGDA